MKTKIFATLALCGAFVGLTGCIEEVEPSGGTITQTQLNSSVKAGMATLQAIPATMIKSNSDNSGWHGDFGYPAMMIIRDEMTGDFTVNCKQTGYDHFGGYAQNYVQQDLALMGYLYRYYGSLLLSCNKGAGAFPADVEEEAAKGCRAKALAYRAMTYLDLARWFEYLPCDGTSPIMSFTDSETGETKDIDVTNLTFPIVTENTTAEAAQNNPRVDRQTMAQFILSDLEYALENIDYAPAEVQTKVFPDKSCVYGLYARLYMWLEDYAKAKEYADLAMAGYTPLTKAQWTNKTTGFNTPEGNNSWMWSCQLTEENRAVTTGICNFTSMMTPEATYGYAGVGATRDCDWSMYTRIPDTDFRKLSWVPYSGYGLLNEIDFILASTNSEKLAFRNKFRLACIKFRPGNGEPDDYHIGSATAQPVMRMEEMAFISMEAAAQLGQGNAKTDFENWMKTYRNPSYTCNVTEKDALVEEIVFNKRVELWGEGQTLWDLKRLNYSVTRGYEGTNFYEQIRFNTDGRPAWTNMVFLVSETNANRALVNNPNSRGCYDPIKDDVVKFNKSNW